MYKRYINAIIIIIIIIIMPILLGHVSKENGGYTCNPQHRSAVRNFGFFLLLRQFNNPWHSFYTSKPCICDALRV